MAGQMKQEQALVVSITGINQAYVGIFPTLSLKPVITFKPT